MSCSGSDAWSLPRNCDGFSKDWKLKGIQELNYRPVKISLIFLGIFFSYESCITSVNVFLIPLFIYFNKFCRVKKWYLEKQLESWLYFFPGALVFFFLLYLIGLFSRAPFLYSMIETITIYKEKGDQAKKCNLFKLLYTD